MSLPLSEFSAGSLFNLTGQVAVVTGGATGIGKSIVKSLAANGATVYLTGRRKNVLEDVVNTYSSQLPNNAKLVPVVMDVTCKDSIKQGVEFIKSQTDYINILVNNAGVSLKRADIASAKDGAQAFSDALFNADIKDWENTYMTNVTSNYYVSSAFIPLLKAAETNGPTSTAGNIINITSISGIIANSQNGQFCYNSSKAAASSLSRLMAKEFSHENINIRVNAISPGYFISQMSPGDEQRELKTGNGFRQKTGCPADRMGIETEMGRAVLSFATNGYLWGSEIVIDGGLTLNLA